MFGSIGGGEILMILALALLLFGPRRLPQIGKTLGKTLAEFRRATYDLKASLEQEVALEDLKGAKDGLQAAGREISDAVTAVNPLGIPRGSLADPPADSPTAAGVADADTADPPAADAPQTQAPDDEAPDRP